MTLAALTGFVADKGAIIAVAVIVGCAFYMLWASVRRS